MRSRRVTDVIEAEVVKDECIPITLLQLGLEMTRHVVIDDCVIVDEE